VTLDEILNAVSIPLEHGGITFRLVPLSSAGIAKWNGILLRKPKAAGDGEEASAALAAHFEKQRLDQMNFLAEHMRACAREGDAKSITGKWVSEAFPQVILQGLAEWFVEGKRPEWAGVEGK
jgi:hypothetical protein